MLFRSFALFGTAAALTDDKISALKLDKVIILYACVGFLFLGAAALFGFSKKVPAGINLEKTENAKKALYALIIVSGFLIILFAPIFNSYTTPEQKMIENLEKNNKDIYKVGDSILRNILTNADTTYTKNFFKDKNDSIIKRDVDSISNLSKDTIFQSRINVLKKNHDSLKANNDQIKVFKKPLESYRLKWLFGALAVIVFGLLFANFRAQKNPDGWGAMKYPQLVLGMLGIFVYVGVEVAKIGRAHV